jgi:hypothetical protein
MKNANAAALPSKLTINVVEIKDPSLLDADLPEMIFASTVETVWTSTHGKGGKGIVFCYLDGNCAPVFIQEDGYHVTVSRTLSLALTSTLLAAMDLVD